MHYSLTADERDLQSGLRAFLTDLVPTSTYEAICDSTSGFDDVLWKNLCEQGWLDLVPMAEESNGSAWPISGVVMAEEFGRRPVPAPVELVAGFLSPVLRRLHPGALGLPLDGALAGGLVTCHLTDLAHHMAQRPDSKAYSVKANMSAEGVTLDGELRGVQFGATASSLVLPVSTGSHWMLVRIDLAASGVSVRPTRSLDRGRATADVTLTDVWIPANEVVSVGADGVPLEQVLLDGLLSYLLFLDGKAVGASVVLLERTIAYVLEREQFGVPIGSFQAVKHKVADIATLVESSRSIATYSAWLVSQRAADSVEAVLSSRLHCADAYRRACELAIQCHGGMGFTWEVGLHVWYRSATYDASVAGLTLDDLARVVGRAA